MRATVFAWVSKCVLYLLGWKHDRDFLDAWPADSQPTCSTLKTDFLDGGR